MGQNLLVASWRYRYERRQGEFKKKIEVGKNKRPVIILTDASNPDSSSFMITIDGKMIKDVNQLEEILPSLVDLMLIGEKKEAIKRALRARRRTELVSLGRNLYMLMKKFNVEFSAYGVRVGLN